MSDPIGAPPTSSVRWRDDRTPSGITVRVAEPDVPDVPDVPDEPDGERRPPLLLIHGLAGGAWYWDRFQVVLAERGFTSHALDLRGHHGSRPVAALGRVSLADYVADAREVAERLGRPIVLGHSLGGLLAQALAEAELVSAAVLLCPMPPRGIGFATPRLALRQLRHIGAMIFDRPLLGTAEDMIATSLNRIPVAEQPSLAARFVADSGRVARQLSLGGLPIAAERVRAPVLVVSATEDRFFTPQVGALVAARYGAEHRVYAEHAHFLVREPGAETIAGDVADWIESTAGIGRGATGVSGT